MITISPGLFVALMLVVGVLVPVVVFWLGVKIGMEVRESREAAAPQSATDAVEPRQTQPHRKVRSA